MSGITTIVKPGGIVTALKPGSIRTILKSGYIDTVVKHFEASVAPSSDPDADAFIAAAVITDPTQRTAINTLVVALKAAGLWTALSAVYPFVGGTAFTHKWNLKDPRDLDIAYRISFSGLWTHDFSGIKGDGTTTFGDTFFIPSVKFTQSNGSFGFYVRAIYAETSHDFSAYNGTDGTIIVSKYTGDILYFGMNTSTFAANLTPASTAPGMRSQSKSSPSKTSGYSNGIKVVADIVESGPFCPLSLYIGALHINTGLNQPSTRYYSFAFAGDTISDSDHLTLYNIVQAFQTTLGRQV